MYVFIYWLIDWSWQWWLPASFFVWIDQSFHGLYLLILVPETQKEKFCQGMLGLTWGWVNNIYYQSLSGVSDWKVCKHHRLVLVVSPPAFLANTLVFYIMCWLKVKGAWLSSELWERAHLWHHIHNLLSCSLVSSPAIKCLHFFSKYCYQDRGYLSEFHLNISAFFSGAMSLFRWMPRIYEVLRQFSFWQELYCVDSWDMAFKQGIH